MYIAHDICSMKMTDNYNAGIQVYSIGLSALIFWLTLTSCLRICMKPYKSDDISYKNTYHIAQNFGTEKFGEFGEMNVIHQYYIQQIPDSLK